MRLFRGNTSWLALIGAGFFWAWLDSVVARPTLFQPFGSQDAMGAAFIGVYAVSLVPIVVTLLSPKPFDRITARPHFGPVVGTLASLGCFAIFIGGMIESSVLLWVGVAVAGFEVGAILLLWGRVCVCQGSFHALLHIVGAYACSLFVDLLIVYLQPIPAAVFLSLCPLISCVLFWTLSTKTLDGKELELGSSASSVEEFALDVAPQRRIRFDAQVILVIVGFYAVLGFASFVNNPATMSAPLTTAYSLAWEVAGLFLFVACTSFGWKARRVSAFGIGTFVLAGIAVLLPIAQQGVHALSGSLLSAGCVAFDVLCWSLVALSHHFTRRPYVGTVAIVAACQQAGTLAGYSLGQTFPQASSDANLYAAIVIGLCVLLIAGTLYVKKSNGMLVSALFAETGAATPSLRELEDLPAEEAGSDALAWAACAEAAPEVSNGESEPAGTSDKGSPNAKKRVSERAPRQSRLPVRKKEHPATSDAKDGPDASPEDRIQELSDRYGLTRREREVFAQLALGRSAPYIAEAYQVSENTVRSHIKHIYTKMGVHSRQELLTLTSGR